MYIIYRYKYIYIYINYMCLYIYIYIDVYISMFILQRKSIRYVFGESYKKMWDKTDQRLYSKAANFPETMKDTIKKFKKPAGSQVG